MQTPAPGAASDSEGPRGPGGRKAGVRGGVASKGSVRKQNSSKLEDLAFFIKPFMNRVASHLASGEMLRRATGRETFSKADQGDDKHRKGFR